jgi:hypothetical protein
MKNKESIKDVFWLVVMAGMIFIMFIQITGIPQ